MAISRTDLPDVITSAQRGETIYVINPRMRILALSIAKRLHRMDVVIEVERGQQGELVTA